MNRDEAQQIVDELTYVNYACNRDAAPEVPAERWVRMFPNGAVLEARYQAEKAINKARYS